jgi:hypothetical protein
LALPALALASGVSASQDVTIILPSDSSESCAVQPRCAGFFLRQRIVETLVGEGQRVGISLAQAQSKAARGRLAAGLSAAQDS